MLILVSVPALIEFTPAPIPKLPVVTHVAVVPFDTNKVLGEPMEINDVWPGAN